MNRTNCESYPNLLELNQNKIQLNEREYSKLSQFIYTNYGIKLPPAKKILVEGRLQKRLAATNKKSFSEYLSYVFSKGGAQEIIHMVDQISTNKTDFFREARHFEYLDQVILPEHMKTSKGKPLNIWCSAASSGEEIYTIAMVLEEFNRIGIHTLGYSILGTDISVEILKKAINAVYTIDRVSNIPLHLKKRYFLKSKNQDKPEVRIVSQLRNKTQFQRLNLMDANYSVPPELDIIFCRNVLIYFDKKTQEEVVRKQCTKLKIGGYFFLGHSESILGLDLPLKQIKPTIYVKI